METKEIWEKYSEELRRYLFGKTGNKDLSEDILQEAFLKVHLKRYQLKSPDLSRPWLYRIINNTLIDFYRQNVHPHPAEVSVNPDETDSHTAENCLLPLIQNLPEKYKEALILSEIKGHKQSKVAELLQISVSGAKSRIQRGRKLLQEGFMDCCDYSLNDEGLLVGEGKSETDCKVCS